jgi:peptide/nickel transport system substrate-binding protein
MKRYATLSIIYLTTACAEGPPVDAQGETGGTLVISTTGDPGSLFPPLILTSQARQITEQIYDYLADVGPGLNTRGDDGFRKQLSDGWRWSNDSLSIAFHLNSDARWHDGKPVTARDVQFTFALYTNPAISRTSQQLSQIDSVSSTDSLTPVFWFKRKSATQFLDAAAHMLILPSHALEKTPVDSLRHLTVPPVGSGRFRFRKWEKGSSVEVVADSGNYRGRAKLDRVIWSIAPEFTTAVTKLFTGNADLFEPLRTENFEELSRHPELRAITLPGLDYVFLQFNLREPASHSRPHPLFADRNLRRAIAMSIDRDPLVRSLFDTLALVPNGPTVTAYPTTDPGVRQIPFDSARSRSLLDSLGWSARGSDGIRVLRGRELAFGVIVPASSGSRVRMAVLLQAQLRRAGIRMNIAQMDYPAFLTRWSGGAFDAALGSWNMGSTPGATPQAWGTTGVGKLGTNFGGYSNPAFDAELDRALAAPDLGTARARFTRAYEIINEDAPAVWLYEPKTVIGMHRRIRTTSMRPGAWWIDLASWWIPAAERIPRDQVPGGR